MNVIGHQYKGVHSKAELDSHGLKRTNCHGAQSFAGQVIHATIASESDEVGLL